MKKLLPVISALALTLVFVPACLYLAGATDKAQMNALMLIGTLGWFVTAPVWIGKGKTQ